MEQEKKEKLLSEVRLVQESYSKDSAQSSFNALVLGESGTGKTFLIRTCRKPVFIDSFDPGGTKTLQEEISAGRIIVDTRWEKEDKANPKIFDLWKREFDKRVRSGFFELFGTYVIDSATGLANSILLHYLKRSGSVNAIPTYQEHFHFQKIQLQRIVSTCLNLPCDFILTGHLKADKDEVSGRMTYRFLTVGDGTVTIPLQFDEVYVLTTKVTASKGIEYRLLTERTGPYLAKSRLSKGGRLNPIEEPDIKKLLEKVGYPSEDKPLI